MTLPLLQIDGWDRYFENAKSRTYAKPQFVCVPNKHGGTGICHIQAQPDGPSIYGLWMWLVQICSRQPPPRQGYLTADGKKDGRRLSARELANIFRCEIAEVYRMLQVTQSPEVAFMRILDGQNEYITQIPDGYQTDTAVSENPNNGTEYHADTTGILTGYQSNLSGDTEQNRTEQKEFLSSGQVGQDNANTTRAPDGYQTDTAVSDGSQCKDTDPIQHSEAKRLLTDLCAAVFPLELAALNRAVWPDDWNHELCDALPLARDNWALIDWAYRLKENDRHYEALNRVTMLRHTFDALIKNLRSEPQKIRSARVKMGLNGLKPPVDDQSPDDGWTVERKKAATEEFGAGVIFRERFSDLPSPYQLRITARIANGAAS